VVKSHADHWIDRSEEELRGIGRARGTRRAHKDYEVWEAKGRNCASVSELTRTECDCEAQRALAKSAFPETPKVEHRCGYPSLVCCLMRGQLASLFFALGIVLCERCRGEGLLLVTLDKNLCAAAANAEVVLFRCSEVRRRGEGDRLAARESGRM
jgi:hypothetical protein